MDEPVAQKEEEAYMSEESATAENGSLTMKLTGNMTLTLQYDFEGEAVKVSFADHSLKVQLSDGTEFKIPVRRRSDARRAA